MKGLLYVGLGLLALWGVLTMRLGGLGGRPPPWGRPWRVGGSGEEAYSWGVLDERTFTHVASGLRFDALPT